MEDAAGPSSGQRAAMPLTPGYKATIVAAADNEDTMSNFGVFF
jgi:hypothetical protein